MKERGREPGSQPSSGSEDDREGPSSRGGDAGASDRLVPRVYQELRRLAHRKLSKEPPGPTLDTTGLVHEAYVRLVQGGDTVWDNRAHFFAAAALGISPRTVKRKWTFARAWLYDAVEARTPGGRRAPSR